MPNLAHRVTQLWLRLKKHLASLLRRDSLILINIFMQILLHKQNTTLALEYRAGANMGVRVNDMQKDGGPKLSPVAETEVQLSISFPYLPSKYSSVLFIVLDQFLVRILCDNYVVLVAKQSTAEYTLG
jgi:hypothetical protein